MLLRQTIVIQKIVINKKNSNTKNSKTNKVIQKIHTHTQTNQYIKL